MKLRAAACGTAVLGLGLLAIGPATAQPYPPYGPAYGPPPAYGPYGPPPVYAAPRHVPAYPGSPVLADDELPPEEIPGGASPRVSGPYPVSPAEPSPYTGSVPAASPEYPPPYRAAPSAAYPPGAPPARGPRCRMMRSPTRQAPPSCCGRS